MTAQSPQVFIVDDDSAVRDSLEFLMDSVDLPAHSFANAKEFLEDYDGRPGVLVLDVRMPGMSGLELQQELMRLGHSQLSIVFISGHGDIPMAVEALKLGAADFLPKPFRDQELLDRVHQALDDLSQNSQQKREIEDVQARMDALTPREKEVMTMVADGKANKVIAIDLGISQRTVEIHRAHVMEKMQVRSLAQLVRVLNTAGFFDE